MTERACVLERAPSLERAQGEGQAPACSRSLAGSAGRAGSQPVSAAYGASSLRLTAAPAGRPPSFAFGFAPRHLLPRALAGAPVDRMSARRPIMVTCSRARTSLTAQGP